MIGRMVACMELVAAAIRIGLVFSGVLGAVTFHTLCTIPRFYLPMIFHMNVRVWTN